MLATRMLDLVVAIVAAFVSPADVDALRSTAPRYLTLDSARTHIAASVVSSMLTRTEPALLLSIAHHESRYSHTEVTSELGGKVSCGVMTPEPTYDRRACSAATRSIAAGYLAGARHLRRWLDVCRDDERCALLGYAGGFRLIESCRREKSAGCHVPSVFGRRAAMIMRAMRRARSRKLEPLRRRGTTDQRARRIRKWTRRGRMRMLWRHFPGVMRFACRSMPWVSRITMPSYRRMRRGGDW